jgi:SAM-dependent methyltransferase
MGSFSKAVQLISQEGIGRFLTLLKHRAAIEGMNLLARSLARDSSADVTRKCFERFLGHVNGTPGKRILELGSRNISHRGLFHGYSEYVGFDINEGPNVDVVGDAHALSRHFPAGHFDAVYSISVFEHLAFPWRAVTEINKVLKPGGLVFTSTHPTFPPHSEPWDFWRFSRSAFAAMLNKDTGFQIIDWAEGLPCLVLPLVKDKEIKGTYKCPAYLQINVLGRKIGESAPSLAWALDARRVVTNSYPRDQRQEEGVGLLARLDGRDVTRNYLL